MQRFRPPLALFVRGPPLLANRIVNGGWHYKIIMTTRPYSSQGSGDAGSRDDGQGTVIEGGVPVHGTDVEGGTPLEVHEVHVKVIAYCSTCALDITDDHVWAAPPSPRLPHLLGI